MDAFIDDGYTENVGIDPVEGVHDGMEFTYRPFAGDEAEQAFRLVYVGPTALKRGSPRPNAAKEKKRLAAIEAESQPEAVKQRLFALIGEQVKVWGFDRKLEPASLNRMRAPLFTRFKDIVLGSDTPDYRRDEDGNRIEATEEDVVADIKNCSAGS